MKKYEDFGFQYLELVWFNYAQGSYAEPSAADAAAFAEDHDFTTALALVDNVGLHALFELDGASPTISYLGPDMTVLAVDTTTMNPSVYLDE